MEPSPPNDEPTTNDDFLKDDEFYQRLKKARDESSARLKRWEELIKEYPDDEAPPAPALGTP